MIQGLFRGSLAFIASPYAQALAECGEEQEARRHLSECDDLAQRQMSEGLIAHQGWIYVCLGRACLALGDVVQAEHYSKKAWEASVKQPGYTALAIGLRGDIAARQGKSHLKRAVHYYGKAHALAIELNMRPLAARTELGLANVLRSIGKARLAEEHAANATNAFSALGIAPATAVHAALKTRRRRDKFA